MKATLFVLRRQKPLPTGPGPDRGRGRQVRLPLYPFKSKNHPPQSLLGKAEV